MTAKSICTLWSQCAQVTNVIFCFLKIKWLEKKINWLEILFILNQLCVQIKTYIASNLSKKYFQTALPKSWDASTWLYTCFQWGKKQTNSENTEKFIRFFGVKQMKNIHILLSLVSKLTCFWFFFSIWTGKPRKYIRSSWPPTGRCSHCSEQYWSIQFATQRCPRFDCTFGQYIWIDNSTRWFHMETTCYTDRFVAKPGPTTLWRRSSNKNIIATLSTTKWTAHRLRIQ